MKKSNVFYWVITLTLVLGFSAFSLYSCQGGGGSDGGSSSGAVGLYLTDDISLFTQVTATIDKVQLLNTGSGASCDLLTIPTAVNIAELANVMQLMNVTQCPAVPYNRIHLEFEKSVELTSGPTGTPPDTTSLCSFVSFKDEGKGNQPNKLDCSGTTCSLDINGAVNVLANQQNKLALDFNLKEFEVEHLDDPLTCSVTMKVSPLHAEDMEGHHEVISGLISDLSTTDKSFILTRGMSAFTVLYSGISAIDQPELDTLLQRAETDGLRVNVTTLNVDLSSMNVTASSLFVKIEGTVSLLNTATHTFTLTYRGGKTISVDYTNASVNGALVNGASVEMKLYGFDTLNYLASMVAVDD